MRCPKCQFDHELQTIECLKCGIVFSRYKPELDRPAAPQPAPAPALEPEPLEFDLPAVDRADAVKEFTCRLLALPSILLFARLTARSGLGFAAGMLTMVLHESGHAVTAWLTGRWAVPLLWVTPHGQTRSWFIVVFITAAILAGGFLAWKLQRWGWVLFAAALLLLQMIALSVSAEPWIIFFGDGGAMVFATILIATFYAPRGTALYRSWGLRWGLLVIGAFAFMHVYLLWTGPFEDIPFGEIEGVNMSDPSLLTEMYGWSVLKLVDNYIRLGTICLVALLALYLYGLLASYLEIRAASQQLSPAVTRP